MVKGILNILEDHVRVIRGVENSVEEIEQAGALLLETLQNGGKILLAGNGGSASDAQHIAAEFVGRFVREREPLPAVSLATDTSALTAIANDYGYTVVFSRQLRGIGKRGDVFIGISTSGNSQNIIEAMKEAKSMGIKTIALVGNDGGKMLSLADSTLIVRSDVTARIQEAHILIGHILCEIVDEAYA